MTVEKLELYLVGGAVRDDLLELPCEERDWVVVGATREQMLELGFKQVGRDFPVFLHPQTGEEYALARTERKTGHGYSGFSVHAAPEVTLEEDLLRRDLTINAMARDPDGRLIDPFGGQKDLQRRQLRHVSGRFVEDPLRVLRAARFAARLQPLGFTIATETERLMAQISASGELGFLAAERLWKEMEKALPSPAPATFFQVLEDCGALAALCPAWHPCPEDLRHLSDSAVLSERSSVRYAALLARQPLAVIEQVNECFKAPAGHRELALISSRHGADCHCKTGDQALALLEGADAWRRSRRFADFLLVCRAAFDLGADEQERLQQAARATARINTKAWRAQRLGGPAMGERVRQARREKLQAWYQRDSDPFDPVD